jgi:hypothetical protein
VCALDGRVFCGCLQVVVAIQSTTSQYEELNPEHFLTKEVLCRLTILAGAGLYPDVLPATVGLALAPHTYMVHDLVTSLLAESNCRHDVTRVGHCHYAKEA